MAFAERYTHALPGNLQDDEHHSATSVLSASALADRSSRHIGALLHRVKYASMFPQRIAKAAEAKARFEQLLAEAIASRDKRKETEYRRELAGNFFLSAFIGDADFSALRGAWMAIVADKGTARRWIKTQDIAIAHILYKRVAEYSLAYYLDSTCKACNGIGTQGPSGGYKVCPACKGTKKAELPKIDAYEKKHVEHMVSELTELEQTHAGVASAKLRRQE
jgi:hypothetical protein